MAEFQIIEARRHHCGMMARAMRAEHQQVAAMSGANLHRELVDCFDNSCFRKAWMIDGHLAGLGGVIGSLASASGLVWLALTDNATRYPVAIVKEARRQLRDLMLTKREVASTILLGDEPARRLAIFLGFHVAHYGIGDSAYSKRSRRLLNSVLETFDERIVDVGGIKAVMMGYHEELEEA